LSRWVDEPAGHRESAVLNGRVLRGNVDAAAVVCRGYRVRTCGLGCKRIGRDDCRPDQNPDQPDQ
jgi:hypothetical protein